MLWKLLKLLIGLAVLGAVALVIYAYAGPFFFPDDFAPPSSEVVEPVTLPGE